MTGERPVRRDFATRGVEPVLAALHAFAPEYSVIRKLPDGVWGAWLVASGEGSYAVLKCIWEADWRARLESAARVVDALAARGAAVPRYLLTGYEPGVGTWYLQEYTVGERPRRLTPSLLADVLELNERQAGLGELTGEAFDWSSRIAHRLRGRPWRDDLAGRFPDAARVLDELEASIEGYRGTTLPRDDAVHGDFLATQLLAERGRLTGVLDWDAAGRGDRAVDLALLFYNVFAQADRLGERPDENVVRRLGEHAIAVRGAELFGLYLAYHALAALRFVADANPKHVAWRASLAERALAAHRRLASTHRRP